MKKQNRQFKQKQKFGAWTLESYLGGGGNGEVWECFDNKGNKGAIKLLRSVKSKPYARFLDEIIIVEQNSNIDGIIPIIDKYLPTDIKDSVPFYVMPVAKSAEKELKGKLFEEKIDAILEISETLQKLHSQGISHRDIKPPNLLMLDSRCSLADFGLVDYPDKKDISFINETIGAKWTMAPEMRRESSKADGIKADIYSLAKTMWIILTEKSKGFDGQYSTESILGLRQFYKDIYTTPLDNLLVKSTDNNPDSRIEINEFIFILEEWKALNKNVTERNQKQWFEIQTKLFPTTFPNRVIWDNINDIITVLKIICTYDSLNHMFFPDGGGLDLEDARLSHEEGCIELDFQLIEILKPKRLLFESFGYDIEWNYFRLELEELEPSGVYKRVEGEEPYEKKYDHEDLTELYPKQYEQYEYLENKDYYEEIGHKIPSSARNVSRWFRGVFVIFCKESTYNYISSTYDGRHNKMKTDEFRTYIQKTVNHCKLADKKM